MKKAIVIGLLMGLTVTPAMATQRGTPEYEALKEYKNKQRAERDAKKADPAPKEKKNTFWSREAERSGFAGTGAMFANGIDRVIPLEKLNSRKTD